MVETTDKEFIEMARQEALKSTCLRRRYGAVLVWADSSVMGKGYNHQPHSLPVCKTCIRDDLHIEHGLNAEMCYAVHAEQAAIIDAAKNWYAPSGTIMYLVEIDKKGDIIYRDDFRFYCTICAKMMAEAGVEWLVMPIISGGRKTIVLKGIEKCLDDAFDYAKEKYGEHGNEAIKKF
jgi:dCMP deaminase